VAEERTKDFREYIQFVIRRKKQIFWPMFLLLLLGAVVTFSLPATYRSRATILIEEQEVPPDLVRSTVTSYADQRIQTIKHQVMSRSNLLKIVNQYQLYPRMRERKTTEEVLKRLVDDIDLEVINAEVVDRRTGQSTHAMIAFTLSYDGESPVLAQKVANEVTSLFLEENLRTRGRNAQETTVFLQQEAEELAERISGLEEKIAEIKERADGALPEMIQLNLQLMNQVDRDLLEADRGIQSLEERKIYLEGQLATLKPNTPILTAGGERILDPEERLKALRAQFVSSSGFISPKHPDMIKMRGEIEALEKSNDIENDASLVVGKLTEERGNLATLLKQYSEEHPSVIRSRKIIASLEEDLRRARPEKTIPVKPENPAYILIQSQFESTLNDLKAMKTTRERLKQRAGEIAARLERTPKIEQEYLDLTRDRDNSVQKYHEIRSKLLEAQVAEGLEVQRKGERFSLIDPPAIPEKPAKPNRPALFLLTIVFAVVGGVGYGAAVESLDHAIHSVRMLNQITKVPPLVVMPYLPNEDDARRRIRRRWSLFLGGVGLMVLAVVFVHLFWLPLDVIWLAALRKWRTM
jgi:uncharacterized protein involved in exopolysaccharide biosynthesis